MHKRKIFQIDSVSPNSSQKRSKQSVSNSLISDNTSIIQSLSKTKIDTNQPQSFPPLMLTEDFQEGSDDTSLNNLLNQITQNLHFEDIFAKSNLSLPKPPQSSSSKHYHSKHYKSKIYEYDYSLYTHIEIELTFTNIDEESKENFISNVNEFLLNEKNFTYYEYSNTKNMNYFALSSVDQLQYEYYYKDNFSEMFRMKTMKNKLELLNKLKRINYINALTSLYKTFYESNSEFYILTSLHAYYFNNKTHSIQRTKRNSRSNNKYKGILITNTISLNKRLSDYDIEPIKLNMHNEESKNNDDMEIDSNNIDDSPAFIPYEDMTLFYNMFIEDNHNKHFNIISPFNFEESTCRKCKFNIKHFTKNASTVITINIHGCIFQNELEKMIDYIHTSKSTHSLKQLTFTMKLTRVSTTDSFYIANSKLTKPTNKVEYKDNEYYFK